LWKKGRVALVLTDPTADMLSRIRNANRALHDSCEMPSSKMKQEIARLLKQEGYIRDYRIVAADAWNVDRPKKDHRSYPTLVIDLKYSRSRERAITNLKRISKPGRRIYARKDRLPRVLGGMGVAILSTSNGLITSKTAEEKGIGGEVVAFIW
jgi:small subunit ribosomal protein S8